jgi:hypothetical protein
MSPPTDATITIAATSVRLPQFAPNETLTWFRRAETHFRLKNVTKSATKADHVLEVLPEEVFRRIAPWLEEQPSELDYDKLKAQLLTEYSPTPAERARRILALPSQPIGDRTAREIWHEISTLCRLPTTTGPPDDQKYEEVDLKKEIWLMSLPQHVRTMLQDTSGAITDLVRRADTLLEIHRTSQRQPHISTASAESLDSECDTCSAQPRRPGRTGTPKDRNRRPFAASLNHSGICSYHTKFGDAARNCLDGCKWTAPKNGPGGRRN